MQKKESFLSDTRESFRKITPLSFTLCGIALFKYHEDKGSEAKVVAKTKRSYCPQTPKPKLSMAILRDFSTKFVVCVTLLFVVCVAFACI